MKAHEIMLHYIHCSMELIKGERVCKSNKNTQIINEVESSLSWCIEEFQRSCGTASIIHSPWICLHNCSSTGEKNRSYADDIQMLEKIVDLNFRKQTLFAYKNQEFNEKQQENVHLMKGDVNGTSPYVISFLYIWKMLYIWGWCHNQI